MESVYLKEHYSHYKSEENKRIHLMFYDHLSLNVKTLIKNRATTEANYTIVCELIIGDLEFVITKDVPYYALALSHRARQNCWMSPLGEILKATENSVLMCTESSFCYQESDDNSLCCMNLEEYQPLPPDLSKGVKYYDQYK